MISEQRFGAQEGYEINGQPEDKKKIKISGRKTEFDRKSEGEVK